MKKWKIIVSVILLLVVATGGTAYYLFTNKAKQYESAATDSEVETITKSEYEIQLPSEETNDDSTNIEDTGETATTDDQTDTNTTNINTNTTNTSESKNQTTVSSKSDTKKKEQTTPTKKLSVDEILAKYEPVFGDLESQANNKIDSLISLAANEYSSKRKSGEDISYAYFYGKYTTAGKELEKSTDAAFNTIYNALLDELKANGYSSKNAKTVKDQYNDRKKERQAALLKKAAKYL